MGQLVELDAQTFDASHAAGDEDHGDAIVNAISARQRHLGIEHAHAVAIAKAIEIPLVKYSFVPPVRHQTEQLLFTGHG